jgi:hypothetical protein
MTIGGKVLSEIVWNSIIVALLAVESPWLGAAFLVYKAKRYWDVWIVRYKLEKLSKELKDASATLERQNKLDELYGRDTDLKQ